MTILITGCCGYIVSHTVVDLLNNGIKVNYIIAPRREGDIAKCIADSKKAKEELGFETKKTLEDMLRDS